jgi:hypothetical protein
MYTSLGEAYRDASAKARRKAKAPPHIRQDAMLDPTSVVSRLTVDEWLAGLDEEKKLALSYRLGWIYADIDLIARETAAVKHHALEHEKSKTGKKSRIDNSDLFKLIQYPNEFISKPFLLRFLIYWLSISDRGAFIYVAPQKGNPSKPVELWPMVSTRVRPIKSKDNYIKYFEYTSGAKTAGGKNKLLRIHPKYVLWFRYPDPIDLWKSLPPLLAALRAAQTYTDIVDTEQKLFGLARGVPLSIVSTDPDINPTDFEVVREQIKSDWMDGTNIAVTRGGTISVASVGFNQKDLETINAKFSSRDEIDSIFFGFPLRTENLNSGDGLKEIDRLIKEKTIHPLLDLIAQELTLQLAKRFYKDNYEIIFEDIRTADRALKIQEDLVNGRIHSVNEMREARGESPFENDLMPDWGDLPVSLATNPSFTSLVYGIGMEEEVEGEEKDKKKSGDSPVDEGRIEKDPDVGNTSGLLDPERVAPTEVKGALDIALRDELKKLRKVKSNNPDREFHRTYITDDIWNSIKDDNDPIGKIDKLIEVINGA